MKVAVYNLQGESIGDIELSAKVFGVTPKSSVVHEVVMAAEKNRRQVLAHTKIRSEVRGGGKKPWKQKGTGRARAGSSRSPLWKGGGVTFGPRSNRNFSVKINKKTKTAALRMVLSDKVANDRLIIVEAFIAPLTKTKELISLLSKLPVKNSSVVIGQAKTDAPVLRAAKNLAKVFVTDAGSLSVTDVLKHNYVVLTKAGLATVEKTFGPKVKTA